MSIKEKAAKIREKINARFQRRVKIDGFKKFLKGVFVRKPK